MLLLCVRVVHRTCLVYQDSKYQVVCTEVSLLLGNIALHPPREIVISRFLLYSIASYSVLNLLFSTQRFRRTVQAGGGQAGMVYDLYGVVNHMGGMTGGHYTACCRSSPCSKDGVEEVTGWGLEHPWLNFDDEFVEVSW